MTDESPESLRAQAADNIDRTIALVEARAVRLRSAAAYHQSIPAAHRDRMVAEADAADGLLCQLWSLRERLP